MLSILSQKDSFKEVFSRAVSYREKAMRDKEIFSFHNKELKKEEIPHKKLNPAGQLGGVDFSWVFYPNGQVFVYFKFADKDERYNEVTDDVINWSLKS